MDVGQLILAYGLYPTIYAVCVISGFVPVVNAEVFLLLVMTTVPDAPIPSVALTATCGQMTAKSIIYATGRGLVRMPLRRLGPRLDKVREQMTRHRAGLFALMLVSAATGLPPYYVVSFAAGLLRTPFAPFFAAGFTGRLIRFTLFAAFPEILRRVTG